MMRTAARCNRGDVGIEELEAADPARNASRIDHLLSRGGYDDIHDEVDRTLLARVLAENGNNLTRSALRLAVTRKRLRLRLIALRMRSK